MPSRVAANTNQVGGDFRQQLATFDKWMTLFLGPAINFHIS